MTKFNPESRTYGEILGPAMEVTDQAVAEQYLKDYTAFIQKSLDAKPDPQGRTAEQLALFNLGYYAGYYNWETQQKVERLFRAQHPIFGSVEAQKQMTPEEVFEAGFKRGARP